MDVYSELNRAQAENLAVDPTAGTKGRFYHKSTTEPLKVDDGTNIHIAVTDRNIATHVSSTIVQAFVPFAPQTLLRVAGNVTMDMTSATVFMLNGAIPSVVASAQSGGVFRIDSADFPVVAGKTPKLRIKAQLFTNDTAVVATINLGFYPVTRPSSSGASEFMFFTQGTLVTGSDDVSFVAPVVDSSFVDTGAGFVIPADGYYAIYCSLSALPGIVPGNARAHIVADLQLVYV